SARYVCVSVVGCPPIQHSYRGIIIAFAVVDTGRKQVVDLLALFTLEEQRHIKLPIAQSGIQSIGKVWKRTADDGLVVGIDHTVFVEVFEFYVAGSRSGLVSVAIQIVQVAEYALHDVAVK